MVQVLASLNPFAHPTRHQFGAADITAGLSGHSCQLQAGLGLLGVTAYQGLVPVSTREWQRFTKSACTEVEQVCSANGWPRLCSRHGQGKRVSAGSRPYTEQG